MDIYTDIVFTLRIDASRMGIFHGFLMVDEQLTKGLRQCGFVKTTNALDNLQSHVILQHTTSVDILYNITTEYLQNRSRINDLITPNKKDNIDDPTIHAKNCF